METKSRTERKYRRLRVIGLIGLVVFSVIFIISAAMLIQSLREYAQGDVAYAELRNNVEISEAEAGSDPVSSSDNQSSNTQTSGEASAGLSAVSFSTLSEENPDFCGWIFQGGTNIDYPIVIGEDNEYYLTHLFSREANKLGCLFMDYRNAGDFSDRNTVIYGHNMKNGSMFHSLMNYKDPETFNEYPTMTIYTENKTYTLELFAGNIVSGDSQFIEFDFENDADFVDYVDNLKANSTFESDVAVEPGDRLVTLCTCTYEYSNACYELVGKLVDETDG